MVVSTQGITVFVPEVLELYVYGIISDPGVGKYLPQVWRNLDLPRGATLLARWLHYAETVSDQSMGVGFPQRPGRESQYVLRDF